MLDHRQSLPKTMIKSKASHSVDSWMAGGRIHSLDGLRAVAILLVLFGHAVGTVGFPSVFDPLHSLGNYGVRFFFVISGFLITHLLLNELAQQKTINIRGFFYRRVLRIFPAYYAYLLIGVMLAHYHLVDILPGDFLHAATYTMNYHTERGWHLNHTWSLAVEEQFYLLWPFALLLLGKDNAYKTLIGLVLLIPLIRVLMWYGLDASPSAITRQFQAVADALAMGCLLAYMMHRPEQLKRILKLGRTGLWGLSLVSLIASAGLYLIAPGWFYTLGQSLANLGAALIVLLCLTRTEGLLYRLLNCKISCFIGALSYSLYLWQEPFLNSYSTHVLQSFPLNILLTFIAAMLSYYLIEIPFQKLRKPTQQGTPRPVVS